MYKKSRSQNRTGILKGNDLYSEKKNGNQLISSFDPTYP